MTEKDIYRKAKKRVKEKKEFYTHLGIYLVAVPFFFAINYLTEDGRHIDWWAFFPTLGWGLGVAIHYFTVFGLPGRHGDEWEERHKEFHMLLLDRCGSSLLLGFCSSLMDQAVSYRNLSMN